MGPYFKGQHPAPCGCYYPDITRIKDDPVNGKRILHCMYHERVEGKLVLKPVQDVNPIPNENWREGERQRLMAITKPRTLPERQ